MTGSVATKRTKEIEENVYEMAKERFRSVFARFDKVFISFSGGKDSTVVLNVGLEVAREMGRLPLDVLFVDEEVCTPETHDYVNRVRQWPDVRMKWACLPILHRNACSREELWWACWDKEAEDRWVRPMPDYPEVVTVDMVPGFKHGMKLPDVGALLYGPENGTVADCAGIRAQESPRRMQSVLTKAKDNFIADPVKAFYYYCKPVYDWQTVDVWTAIHTLKWDYNQTYEVLRLIGAGAHKQRVCPPWGEEPLRGLHEYSEGWPELWDKMTARVKGCNTAKLYAKTDIYGWAPKEPPKGMTWQEWAISLLKLYPRADAAEISTNIKRAIKLHRKKTKRPIPETTADIHTGLSWKAIAQMIARGDLKGRKLGALYMQAVAQQKKADLTIKDVQKMDAADTSIIV